jgi:hypothetical protein
VNISTQQEGEKGKSGYRYKRMIKMNGENIAEPLWNKLQ